MQHSDVFGVTRSKHVSDVTDKKAVVETVVPKALGMAVFCGNRCVEAHIHGNAHITRKQWKCVLP
jgi:hypothetical protein